MALASQLALDRENGKRSALGKSSNHRAHYLSTLHERPSDILWTNKYRLHRRLVFARFLPTLRNIPSTAQTTFMSRESEKKETVPFFWRRGLNPFVPSWSVAKEVESNLQVPDCTRNYLDRNKWLLHTTTTSKHYSMCFQIFRRRIKEKRWKKAI